jgi:C4-dicarboxylate-specific signal transduction histidine kinase
LVSCDGVERAREQLGVIERQAESCARIVRELMVAAREPTAEVSLVDLRTQLEAAVRMVQPLLKEYGVQTLDIHCTQNLQTWVDPATLEHVLFNLLTNAAQAGARHIALSCADDEGGVWIDVQDDGSGVPDEVRERIFESFVTSKSAGEGTGLGLYMCSTLLTSLGGRIALLTSQTGETIFRIYLRRA